MLQISQLYIYPIKSLPGISLQQACVTEKGFEHDRRWMLVDENNRFISQRERAQMTQLVVSVEKDGLRVSHRAKKEAIIIPFQYPVSIHKNLEIVSVWDDACEGEFANTGADEWFSDMLDIKCRLAYMTDNYRRVCDQRYALPNSVTSFADAYHFMMIGQASLDDLNSRMKEPLPMDRFRPNIVFTGGEPFEEDLMGRFTVGDICFYGVKLCARCNIPTIDQQSGIIGKEPLKTLARYRRKNNNIYFGQNLIHTGEGMIAVGDEIQTVSLNYEERFMINQKG